MRKINNSLHGGAGYIQHRGEHRYGSQVLYIQNNSEQTR